MSDQNAIYRHRWALLLLVAALAISLIAVRTLRRPGAMSVIEAQAMDMKAMKAPVAAIPVAVQKVSFTRLAASSTYPATVVAYTGQDIFPRVEGWLRGLDVYPGDRVSAGQVLAVLDAPDIEARAAEAASAANSASRQIGVAAHSSRSSAARAAAARKNLNRAQMELKAVRSEAQAAERRLAQTRQSSKQEQADLTYQRAEIERSEALLRKGAISRSEYEQDRARLLQAEASALRADEAIAEAGAMAEAARARLVAAESGYSSAADELRAVEAEAAATRAEVGVKSADAATARAAEAAARAFSRFRTIRAPFAGVVTRRLINSGTLVGPSAAVARIEQIDRVRIQASLSQNDAGRYRVGDPAEVIASDGTTIVQTRLSAVLPSTDPATRNTIVEAVIPNPGHRLLPGESVSMAMGKSSGSATLTVPTAALVYRGAKTWVWTAERRDSVSTVYYCTMHPEVRSDKPGSCPKCRMDLVRLDKGGDRQARLVEVKIGQQSDLQTEVLAGLDEGDEVIWAGHQFLRRGDPVKPVPWDASGGGAESKARDKPVSATAPAQQPGQSRPTRPKQGAAKPSGIRDRTPKYHCPMHPEVTSDKPGSCPKCKMDLVPIES